MSQLGKIADSIDAYNAHVAAEVARARADAKFAAELRAKWAQLRALGDARVLGVRRRVYMPAPGFHPGLPPLDPLVIEWENAGRVQRIELRSWKPDGGPYDGLPTDASAALARRNERVAITIAERIDAIGRWPQTRPYTIDLRY